MGAILAVRNGKELPPGQFILVREGRPTAPKVWLKETDQAKREAFGGEEISLGPKEAARLTSGKMQVVEAAPGDRMKFRFAAGDRWISHDDYWKNIRRCEDPVAEIDRVSSQALALDETRLAPGE